MSAHLLVVHEAAGDGVCDHSSRTPERRQGWKTIEELKRESRIELLRQQYLNGALFIDEYAIARKMLLHMLPRDTMCRFV